VSEGSGRAGIVLFEIGHASTYAFSEPVYLEPHTIRLRPRSDGSQRLIRYSLAIEPKPAGLAESLDLDGNVVAHAWFNGLTDSLKVTVQSEVETLRRNPFDYILSDPATDRLPMEYADELGLSVAPYCLRDGADDAVAVFASTIADETGRHPLPFLAALNRRIYQMCEMTIREEGDPQPPAATLADRRGACRDLAVLFVDACRSLGFGARFVSGYQEGDPDQTRRYLHAWAEAYLPGGGWRGYDPTLGLAVADRHVAVAAGIRPGLAAPITGNFRGAGVASRMQADLRIRVSGKALP
jgi:transglutaminase-like putative cysteine protease